MTLPDGWLIKPLAEVAQFVMGQSPDSRYYSEEEVGLPFLQGCAEFQGRYPKHAIYCSHSKKIGCAGSILLSVRAPVGRLNVANRDYVIGRGLAALKGTRVTQDFLEHFLVFQEPTFRLASQGSTFEAINASELKQWPILYPKDKAEQAKIAEVLSTMDRAIEETKALIAKQQRVKTGLMQNLLTRGIDEHGNLRAEKTHEFKDSALGRIPAEWDVAGLSTRKHAKKPYLKTGPFGSSLKISDWVEHGIPVITIGALGEGSFEESDLLHISMAKAERLAAYALEPGDIVFSRVADVGRSVVVTERERDWIMSSNMMRISIDVAKADPNFLRLNIVKHPGVRVQIRQTVNASGREVANQQVLDALRFPWPSVDEQRRIVRTVAQQSEQIVRKEACLAKFRRAKAGLMLDLLTGNRRVTALLEQREEVTT